MDDHQDISPSYRVHVVEEDERKRRGIVCCQIGERENINFNTDDLASYVFAEWRPIIFDTLLLAAAVEFCDRSLRRKSGRWSRNITLRLPVHDAAHWNANDVIRTLGDALNFLTGDRWNIIFEPRKRPVPPPEQRPLSLPSNTTAVIPFSDGLDSWSIATLVEHQSESKLVRVRLLSRKVGRKPIDRKLPFASVPYHVDAPSNGQPLTTGRHRGFKYAIISGIAANLAQVDRVIMPESGQGALGPSLVPVGQMYPDYRNHPLFTVRMERFLAALLGRPIHYAFPRLWNTKGETLRAAIPVSANPEVWQKMRTCWQDSRQVSDGKTRRQCGICAACMLRRLSVHAAGLNESKENYIWENLGANTFVGGAISSLPKSKSIEAFREDAIAGALHMDHLAALPTLQVNQAALRRHAYDLVEWRGERPADIEIRLRGLLERHRAEWKNFIGSLGADSFIKPWARAAA